MEESFQIPKVIEIMAILSLLIASLIMTFKGEKNK